MQNDTQHCHNKKNDGSWNGSCNAINCKFRVFISRCRIQRKKAFCESIMITNKSSGPAMNCSQTFQNQEERKKSAQKPHGNVGSSKHETNLLHHPCSKSIPIHKKNTNEKKWIVIHAHSRNGGHLAVSISKMVTTTLKHFDQEERRHDGSRHWDSIKPVLMKAFAHEGAQDFDDGFCLRLIHDGSTKKRLEHCQDTDGKLCYFRAIQAHSGGIPTSPQLMK